MSMFGCTEMGINFWEFFKQALMCKVLSTLKKDLNVKGMFLFCILRRK